MSKGQMNLDMDYEEKKVWKERTTKLSQAEAAAFGIEVGALAGEIETHKKAAKDAEAAQDKRIEILKKNEVTKSVECVMKLFFNTRTVQIFDGTEMIEERAMTDDEFQMEFGVVKNGVVEDDDVIDSSFREVPQTCEEAKKDLEDVIKSEKRADKPSLVELR